MSTVAHARFSLFVTAIFLVGRTCLSSTATASLLVLEEFTHADGDLVGQTPTPGPGAEWAGHSGGTTNAIQVASSAAVINQAGGQDANTGFAARSLTDTTYARFDFSLPSATNGDITNLDPAGLYFAMFRQTNLTFRARVGVLQPTLGSGGDFKLVLSDSSDLGDPITAVSWGTDLAFDTTYRVVTSYNADTSEIKLWLDPLDEASTSISAIGALSAAEIDSYAIRQNNDYAGQMIFDNLSVATSFDEALTGVGVPEPGTFAMMVFAACCLGVRRRS